MTRDLIWGAFYGEALPSGEWCALVPGQGFQTHLGPVGLPPGESYGLMFPRCTNVGGFRFGGQAHDTITPAAWQYDHDWISYPQPCVGVNAVIYDRKGTFVRSDGSVGSQGYRYVTPENVIVSGDATYGPFFGLFEYTALARCWIGQGAYDGAGIQVWDGAVLRQLETGDCRFLRAHQAGDQIALAFTRPEGVVLMHLTEAELLALPPAVLPVDPPKPPDPLPPDPPIPPKPRPPDPPQPPVTKFFNQHKERIMSETKTVVLRGPAGKLARIVAGELGQGPFGWYPIHWDGTDPADEACHFVQTKPDARFKLQHKVTGALFGADATSHAADPAHPFDISRQFYGKPDDDRGWGESPCIYEGNLNGALQGVVEYEPNAGGFLGFSAAFAVEAVA